MKKPSLVDVANRAGVSISTASRVLSCKEYAVSAELRERVLKAARELDYRPNAVARTLRTQRSRVAGVLVHDITDPYFSEIARGVEDVANRSGFLVIVCNTDRKPEKESAYIRLLLENQVSVAILAGGGHVDPEHSRLMQEYAREFRERKGALVALSEQGFRLPTVAYDNRALGEMAGSYLVECGHRDILFIAGPREIFTSYRRLEGFKLALSRKGIDFPGALVIWGDFTQEGGYRAVLAALKRNLRFTAVCASNDQMALGAMRGLQDSGIKVPQEVSVMGMNNISASQFARPALTTIRVSTYQMGRKAMELAFSILADPSRWDSFITVDTTLVVRESVANLNAHKAGVPGNAPDSAVPITPVTRRSEG